MQSKPICFSLFIFLAFCTFVVGGVQVASAAVTYKKAPHIEVALVAEQSQVQPGQTVWVGVHQKIDKDWHTYWSNPGDSGLAPTMTWTLPKGVTASRLVWPVPHKIHVKHLANYGYEGQVLLMSEIKVPSSFAGKTLQLGGSFSWLVCKEECIPGKAKLALEIPVAQSAKPSQEKALFQTFRNKLPQVNPKLQFKAEEEGKLLKLTFQVPESFAKQWQPVSFYPQTSSMLHNATKQSFTKLGTTWSVKVPKNDYYTGGVEKLKGLLLVSRGHNSHHHLGFKVANRLAPTKVAAAAHKKPATTQVPGGKAQAGKSTQSNPPTKANSNSLISLATVFSGWKPKTQSDSKPSDETWLAVLQALLFAFLGGLILNLMPCVFPVLSIKVLHFVEQSEQESSSIRLHGVAFWLGIQLSFTALASVLMALRSGGASIGWGFQLQHPPIIFLLAAVMFAMGLSLSGLFEVGSSLMGVGDSLASKSGYMGSFFTGILATVVATPCTAPLMGAAIAYALVQPVWIGLLIFNGLGLGMASPYLALSFFPSLLKKMPRPGAWMEKVKQILAFPLYAAGIWLLWVLGKQAGLDGMVTALVAMLLLSVGCWLYGTTRMSSRAGLMALASLLFVVGGFVYGYVKVGDDAKQHMAQQAKVKAGLELLAARDSSRRTYGTQEPYTRRGLALYLKKRENVFLNLTAAWCISCKVNERVALRASTVKDSLKQQQVRYLVGDWTHRDKDIAQILERFNRNGVPLYVLFHGKTQTYEVLPQILTPGIVVKRLQTLSKKPSKG